jgi:mannose/fructose/N-acetylgalactosamine-specific phosphotransferase system component IIB
MSGVKKANIAVILLGRHFNPLIDILLKLDNVNLDLICSTLLDYELPIIEDKTPITIRSVLVQTLIAITDDIQAAFPIPAKIEEVYKEKISHFEDIENFGVVYNTNQIIQNTASINSALEILIEQTGRENVRIFPLSTKESNLAMVRSKKWAPLRYYSITNKIDLDESSKPESIKKKKSNTTSKRPELIGIDDLQEIKIPDVTLKALEKADLTIITSSDLVSLAVFFKMEDMVNKIKKATVLDRSVMIWHSKLTDNLSEVDKEIVELLNFDPSLEGFSNHIANLTDYVITDINQEEIINSLRADGTRVLTENVPFQTKTSFSKAVGLLEILMSIADFKLDISTISHLLDDEEAVDEDIPELASKNIISIEELSETDEESGINKLMKMRELSTQSEDSSTENQTKAIETNLGTKDTESNENVVKIEAAVPFAINGFEQDESERWEDTVKRAIDEYTNKNANSDDSLNWLVAQCLADQDQEISIANTVVYRILENESTVIRKKLILIVNRLYETHQQSYIQIFSQHLLSSITNKDHEKRKNFVNVFAMLQNDNIDLSEKIILSIIKDITIEREDPVLAEISKLTLIQLVIRSTRLTRVTISKILNLIDARTDSASNLWNYLLVFDAPSVAIELITQFSKFRAEELVRRAPILRYTGSFITTLQSVMTFWNEGDKNAIANFTGMILPETTLRKLERMDVANKIKKLRTVPLLTLAETLNMKSENLELLVAELIMKDDLNIKLEVIDNRMVVVYNENSEENQ